MGSAEDLVARCQAGDVEAFETIYRQHASRLYTLACRMAGSPEDGEDLLQKIFLQAYRKLGSFKGDATLGTWLYRLALNHCLDYVRSRRAKMNRLTSAIEGEIACEPAARRERRSRAWIWSAPSNGCLKGAARRSSCTTSKGSITKRSAGCSASPRAPRNRRCSRRA